MEMESGSVGQRIAESGSRMWSRVKWCFLGCGIVIVLLVFCAVLMPGGLTKAVGWLGNSSVASMLRSVGEPGDIQKASLVEMEVENVGISRAAQQPVVLLKQKDGERYLPIWIGLAEMNAISVVWEGLQVPRPLTPDLLCTIVDELGARVEYVVVTDLKNSIFYANVVLNTNWGTIVIDSRPSDAIAIAMRVKAPIYVTRELLDKAGITPDAQPEKRETVYHRGLVPLTMLSREL